MFCEGAGGLELLGIVGWLLGVGIKGRLIGVVAGLIGISTHIKGGSIPFDFFRTINESTIYIITVFYLYC